jgi:glycosyl transferase, family 25
VLHRSATPVSATIDWSRSRPEGVGDVVVCAINLDRSPERWDAIHEQLAATSLPFLRLAAFEGRALSLELATLTDHEKFRRANGRNATPGELGCYFSHVAAWTVLAKRPERYLLVVEDDAVFEPGWTETLKHAVAAFRPGMLLKLSWQRQGVTRFMRPVDETHSLVRPLTHQACNAAYLIDREAAANLLAHAFPLHVPADHYVESPWLTGVRVRTVVPAMARQRGVASTIAKPKKFHWSQRLPTFIYRLKAHTRRLWYNVFRAA